MQIIPLGQLIPAAATIANGQTTTGEVKTNGCPLAGIQLPAALTGVTITFLVSTQSGGTYQPLYNSSGQVSYTVAPGRYLAINPQDFHGVGFLKVVSGSAEGAQRALTLMLKGM